VTPGASATYAGAIQFFNSKGLPASGELQPVPISDADSVALNLVAKAGKDGGVVINFAPSEVLKILVAIQELGLINDEHWSCVACADQSLVAGLGSAWNGKLAVMSEVAPITDTQGDNGLYDQIDAKYAPTQPLNLFGQFGFLTAEIFVSAVQKLPASQLNKTAINRAILNITDYKSDMLCKAWYFYNLKYHLPNNYARVLTPLNKRFVQTGACVAIPAVKSNELAYIRQQEKLYHLNS
jgi:branched-chain amino acid transport system substrate-binding protein